MELSRRNQEIARAWGYDAYPAEIQGYFSTTFLVPSTLEVLKFPKSSAQEERYKALEREMELLDWLHYHAPRPPVAIPRTRGYESNVFFAALEMLPGVVMAGKLEELSCQEWEGIATQLAHSMFWLAQAMPLQAYIDSGLWVFRRPSTRIDELRWLKLKGELAAATPALYQLVCELQDNLALLSPLGGNAFFFGHNDLHPGNLMLARQNGQWRLGGIFDFGHAQPSSPSYEMRFLYALNPSAARICAATFRTLSGWHVDEYEMRLQANTQYVILAHRIITNMLHDRPDPDRGLLPELKAGLQAINPQSCWDELDQFM